MKHGLYAARYPYTSNVTPERLKDQSPGSCAPSSSVDGIPVLTKARRSWTVGCLIPGLMLFRSLFVTLLVGSHALPAIVILTGFDNSSLVCMEGSWFRLLPRLAAQYLPIPSLTYGVHGTS